MGKIIAMGGGSISSKDYRTDLDREVIRLSGKRSPRVLFIPTASTDSSKYIEVFRALYEKRLKCPVDVLRLYPTPPIKREIDRLIGTADVIYVGGGNTLKMIARWKYTGVDVFLRRAYQQDKVLCGPSAGAIAWFAYGHSDSRKFRNPQATYIRVSALGFIPALLCPHFDTEPKRQLSLKRMLKKKGGVALAVDEHAAIEIIDDTFRIIRARQTAQVYRCYWSKDTYVNEVIPVRGSFVPCKKLLQIS
jgi:dipeptidase E